MSFPAFSPPILFLGKAFVLNQSAQPPSHFVTRLSYWLHFF